MKSVPTYLQYLTKSNKLQNKILYIQFIIHVKSWRYQIKAAFLQNVPKNTVIEMSYFNTDS